MTPMGVYTALQPPHLTRGAASDDQLIALWLHGRPPNTQRAYRADSDRFLAFLARLLCTSASAVRSAAALELVIHPENREKVTLPPHLEPA